MIVHRYPKNIKAFYFATDPSDPELALNMDVLAPEGYGEIVGGGQREDDLARLEAAIAHHKLPPAAFEWYLDVRRYGSFPHAGFGLGIERTGRVDLRPRARARDDPVPEDAEPPGALIEGRSRSHLQARGVFGRTLSFAKASACA